MSMVTPPLNIAQLNARLSEVATEQGIPVDRVRLMLCTLVVSQMMPEAVAIKGGMGIKLRLGEHGTRATSDLDVASRSREEFEEQFRARLQRGWGRVPASKGALRVNPDAEDRVAFTGALRRGRLHDPGLVAPQYLVHPYRVSLSFLGREWAGLDVEVSDPEIEPRDTPRKQGVDQQLARLGSHFGFGDLKPIQLIDLEHQIAQKLHAVTDPAYERAHDLVDLQILWTASPDLDALRELCVRTFDLRRAQSWPPVPLRPMDGWDAAYLESRMETVVDGATSVLATLDEARTWVEDRIRGLAE